ncbi:recombinase family protein [Robertmurraya yapensis]|uniref:Recombinase family protein n=1 Tax=Bacillus yapensis TaxID=2492960 RepID=A0A3S0IKH7_9BACI|nr:recombinase family protein [Bacillus yapensis]RTR36216.1 recombinase family protein [Bacillus yapensis]TKT05719.1 recombinase family protein [Bacillus yapensis]
MLIGYMRPSEDDPNCEEQQKNLIAIPCDSIFSEEHSSPKKRIQLKTLLSNLDCGDKVVISKLSTLADSSRHLVELLEVINSKGAFIFSLKEGIDTSNGAGHSFYEIVRHLVEFQSDLISERTKQGLTEAKQKGVTTGRPRKPDKNVQRAIEMYQSKNYTLAQIKEETGISKSTLYRYLEN